MVEEDENNHELRERLRIEKERIENFNEELRERCTRRTASDIKWVYKQLKTDVEFAFRFFWDIGLNDKQKQISHSYIKEDHTVAICSRQVGKTMTGGGTSAWMMMFKPNTYIGLYAPRFDTAIDVGFGTVKGFFHAQPLLETLIVEELKSGYLEITNENSFKAQTANDRSSIRGYSPSVVWIDESPEISNETYDADILGSGAAIKGITYSGGYDNATYTKILETGTPKGRNHFHRTIRPMPPIIIPEWRWDPKRPKRRPVFGVDYHDIVPSVVTDNDVHVVYMPFWESHTVDLKYVEKRRKALPPKLFQQEFCCAFNSTEGYAFDYGQVSRACHETRRKFPRMKDAIYCAGVDLGRNQDHTVMIVYRCDRGVEHRQMVFMNVWDLLEDWIIIFKELEYYFEQWRPNYTMVDKTGIGDPIYDAFFARLPYTIEPFVYTMKSKADLMRCTEMHLEDDMIDMWDDEDLFTQMKDAPIKPTESGVPKYPKPESGVDDIVQANALALYACREYMGDGDGSRKIATADLPGQKEFRDFMHTEGFMDDLPSLPGMKSGRSRGARVSERSGSGFSRSRVNFKDVFDH